MRRPPGRRPRPCWPPPWRLAPAAAEAVRVPAAEEAPVRTRPTRAWSGSARCSSAPTRCGCPALHARWSLSAEGEETIEDAYVESVTCAGARCVTADGTATTVRDLAGASSGTGTAGTELGTRGGFDTASARGGFAVSETLDGVAVTAKPAVTTWGFWGDHGFAALALGAGEVMAEIGGTAFEGTFSMAQVWALGDATGTNPVGTGSATWTGIAEASPTGTFERLQGHGDGDNRGPVAAPGRRRRRCAGPRHRRAGLGRHADCGTGPSPPGTAGTDYLAGAFHGARTRGGLGGVRHREPCRRVRGEADAVSRGTGSRQGVTSAPSGAKGE